MVEKCKVLAVNVEHRHHVALLLDGDHNFAARGRTTGYMAGELLHVRHHEGAAFFPGRPADTLAEGDVHASHRPLEGAEHQFVLHNTVEACPPEMESVVQQGGGVGHAGNGVLLAVEQGAHLFQRQSVLLGFLQGAEVAGCAGLGKKGHGQVTIAVGIGYEIVLMVVLGTEEVDEGLHLDLEGFGIAFGLAVHDLTDEGEVVGVGVVDARAVARAAVLALLIQAGGVYGLEIHLQQKVEADTQGVETEVDGLGKARGVGVDLLVGGVVGMAVGKAHLGEKDTVNLFEKMLGAPKAPSREIEIFIHGLYFNCYNALFLLPKQEE